MKDLSVFCRKHRNEIHLSVSVILLIVSIMNAVNLFLQENQLAKQTSIVVIIAGILIYCGILIYRLCRRSKS